VNKELPLTVDTGRGFSINYKGQNLYSRYNPSRTPERIAGEVVMEGETLYILPSPLLFYGVSSLLDALPESSFILGIECDEELMKLSLKPATDLSHPQFELVRLDSREQLKVMLDRLGVWRFRRCKALYLNNGYNLYRDSYENLITFASHHISTFWRNRLTLNKLGHLWIKNIFQNTPLLNNSVPDNCGKPVVVCGAGPSLDSTLRLLKKYRKSLYIIAVDTALATLLESEIVPDLVYALESQFYNLGDFHNSGNYNFHLLADITSYPQICRMNRGSLSFSRTAFSETILLKRLEKYGLSIREIPPLGSVGVAAAYSAMEFFNEPVFLTGLDFSYTPGKSHSKGSPFIKTLLMETDRFHPLVNQSGTQRKKMRSLPGKIPGITIQTDSILAGYGQLLSEVLQRSNRFYDLSEVGYPLGIPLVDKESFSELLKTLEDSAERSIQPLICQFDYRAFLNNEKALLGNLIHLWDKFVLSEQSDIPRELIEALVMVDYVYIDFPDRLPHPVENVSFLSRAVKKAREYSGLIEKIKEM